MDKNKIAEFIKQKRKEQNLTQEELAQKLFVTEKAISRWETARGTPDISLLIPLSKELKVSVSELLNGKSNAKENINDVITYVEMTKKPKLTLKLSLSFICYLLSILIFLIYLRIDYNSNIEINYFSKLILIIISSLFLILGSYLISINYIDKLDDKNKFKKLILGILFSYYSILLFNMTFFARNEIVNSYNLIPFKTIIEIINKGNFYEITINLFGNFFVFMPISYFLIELFNVKKPLLNFITSFLIIFLIETIQYIFNLGVFDIDDLILCLSGMMTFFFLNTNIIKKKELSKC